MLVSISMSSGSSNPNMAVILHQPLFFNTAATFYVFLLHYLNTAVRNNATCFFGSAAVFSLVD